MSYEEKNVNTPIKYIMNRKFGLQLNHIAATAKFRLDFFIARLVPTSRPCPRYRVPVIISPVSLSGSIIKSLRIYLLSELRKLI